MILVAYKPVLRVTYNDATLVRGASVSWGTVNSPVSKDIVLHNDGAAPLSVSSVSVADGYSPYTAEIPLLTESEVTYNISLSKIATSLTPSDADSSDSGVYYNVYGQPVSKDYKGIVIIRGKKILNL